MIPSKIRGIAAPLKARLRLAMLWAATLAAAGADAKAAEFRLFPASPPRPRYFSDFRLDGQPGLRIADLEHSYPWSGGGRPDLGLVPAAPPEAEDRQEQPPAHEAAPPPAPKKLFTTGTTLWTVAAVIGGVAQGIEAPLKYGWTSFHTIDEGWFGRDTYAGGADKTSHFIISSGVSRLLYEVYTRQGHTQDQSALLAFGAAFMSGVTVELFDAASVYGFSFQDLTADALGSAAGVLIQRNHLQDLLGLRVGGAGGDIPQWAVGSSEEYLGVSYNDEIFVGDLKLGGLITRLHGKPGIARFFLTSVVYFTRGYGYAPPLPSRYQEVGFELGLNFPEILKAVGVQETTWWGQVLYAFFGFFRIPYTQIGAYYNLSNHKWYGPAAPYHYYSY